MGLGATNVVEITASASVNVNARKQATAVAIAARARNDDSAVGTAVAERNPLRSAYALRSPSTFAEVARTRRRESWRRRSSRNRRLNSQ